MDGEEQRPDGKHQQDEIRRADDAHAHEKPHGLDVGCRSRHELSGLLLVVIGEAHPLQMVVQGVADVVGHMLSEDSRR